MRLCVNPPLNPSPRKSCLQTTHGNIDPINTPQYLIDYKYPTLQLKVSLS